MRTENDNYENEFDKIAAQMDGDAEASLPGADLDDQPVDALPDELPEDEDAGEQGAPAESETPVKNEKPAENEQPQEPDDLEQLRAENQKLQHQLRSESGRQAALQQKAADLEARLNQSQPPAEEREAAPDGVSDDDWNEIKENYPDIADALDGRLNAAVSNAINQLEGQFQQKLQPFEQQAQQQYLDSQFAALESRHPDWKDVAQAPEFQSWLDQQPANVRQMYGSKDAADAAYLLDTYKATHAGFGQAQDPNPGNELREKRKAQLAQAVTQPRRGAANRDPNAGSYDAHFEEAARKLDARR